MKIKMALTLVATIGALLAVTPASAAPIGAAGQAISAAADKVNLVEKVHNRHWRRHHRYYAHRYNAYRYRPYYYSSYQPSYYYRPYYRPYYSPYYYGYSSYYGHRYHRRGGVSVRIGF